MEECHEHAELFPRWRHPVRGLEAGRLGTGVLVAGWTVVVAGIVVVGVALGGNGSGRDESAGVGLVLVMAGLMIVLAGNYMHHRSVADGRDSDTGRGSDGLADDDSGA